jgi:crotonobetainyl-CoA:carnitine CoA-transferase CaiB-like acyl-CoA transferase
MVRSVVLNNVKVLSFNHFLAGPMAAQTLGDLGADVIAIEPLQGAFQRNWAVANHFVDGYSVNHLATGRNKKSLAVDLKSPEGLAVIKRLVADADVVMENFRPGTMEKLGLGYEALKAINPGLIYAVASGFGSDGPYKQRPGQDLLLQALSGLAARTGDADGKPTPAGPVIVDQHAAMIYAMSICAALYNKAKTGEGRLVEVNLYQAAIDLQGEGLTAWLNGAPSEHSRGPGNIAAWFSGGAHGIHSTADGYIAISMAANGALAQALDLPALSAIDESEGFSRREEIAAMVGARLLEQNTAHWLPLLDAAGVWNAPVNDYADLQKDPQLIHNQVFQTIPGDHGTPITVISLPARFDGKAPDIRMAPQPLGAQTREILAAAGYSDTEVEQLLASKAIGAVS